jgi:hypothetical protein
MFSQYFGSFLLNKGLITPEQFNLALELQKSAHLKLGVLSVNAGFMTPSQVEEVHQKQMQVDKRFGEIAIDLGYITDPQLEEILSSQKHSHLLLGQVLIDEDIMDLQQFTNALNQYKDEFSLSDDQFDAIKRGDIDTLVDTMVSLGDLDSVNIKDYLSLLAKNLIRFVDDQIRMDIVDNCDSCAAEWMVHQQIHGSQNFFTALLCDEKVFVNIAAKYAQEDLSEPDELAQASVSELLNLHNGIFTVNMSNLEIELEMKPQQVKHKGSLSDLNKACVVKITMPTGDLFVVISEQTPVIK